MQYERVVLIVLDSVGVGELPDADQFGDVGANTLGHIVEQVPDIALPNLSKMGVGNIVSVAGLPGVESPQAHYGKMAEISVGKDTMTGHWELMGLRIEIPFQTYPDGFPEELIQEFEEETGRKVLGNKAASGTEIIEEYGQEQMETGAWIVYTSADSVFQLAAHEDTIQLDELYRACEIARKLTMTDKITVGRVIARPYIGSPGEFIRTAHRHDYAVKPPEPTVMNHLQEAGMDCIAVGKINDIFSGEGVTESRPTKSNQEGIEQTIELLNTDFRGLMFVNLVDFDSLYGHRRDPRGYAAALEEFDQRLPEIMGSMNERDLLIITADHGNDPTHSGTDHTREYVPLLVWSKHYNQGQSLGIRSTFADVAATIAANFKVLPPQQGTSFIDYI